MGKRLALAVIGVLVVAGGIWVVLNQNGGEDAADQQAASTTPADSTAAPAGAGEETAETSENVVYDAMVPPAEDDVGDGADDGGQHGADAVAESPEMAEPASGDGGQAEAAATTADQGTTTAGDAADDEAPAGDATSESDTARQADEGPKVVPRESIGAGTQTQTAARPADPDQTAAESQAPTGGVAPSFDVVRVEKSGETLIAGRAAPGSEVTVFDGDTPIGKVTADGTGSWVLLPKRPLEPGTRELFIRSTSPNGETRDSEDAVIVAVREPEQKPAEEPTAGAATAPSATAGAETEAAPTTQETAALTPEPDNAEVEAAAGATADTREGAAEETPLAVLVPRDGEGPSRVLQQPTEGEIGDQALILKAIDYDSSGRVIISGDAVAGARIIVYLDNRAIGETIANENGRWALSPPEPMQPGLHRLRVDQLDDGGKVVARVETPFSRADFLTTLPDERFVIVQPGNSLWRIARRTYGEGIRYSVIYQSNQDQIRDPDVIYPGQIFMVPQVN